MKQSLRMLTIVALLTFGLATFGIAQMMGGNHDHSMKGNTDSASQSGMMNKGKMDKGMMKMGDMSKNCKMMSNNFEKLEKHFGTMMQMNDMSALKSEMMKHQEMMQTMMKTMSDHQAMCMNMMNSDGKMDMDKMGKMGCGMMGNNNMNSSK